MEDTTAVSKTVSTSKKILSTFTISGMIVGLKMLVSMVQMAADQREPEK